MGRRVPGSVDHCVQIVGYGEQGSTTYRKATPDRLCEAVSNYAELCAKYRKSDLAQFFTEPCSTPCRARADRTG